MRHINALPADKVPRDDEFKFRERAKALVDKWHEIISASKASEGAVRKPATNGKPHAEDAGANGKEEANGKEQDTPTTHEPAKDAMEVDTKEESANAPATADEKEEKDAPADEESPAEATGTADEPTADVAMTDAA